MLEKPPIDSLLHYGVKRRSGRYPWGSGDDAKQRSMDFLDQYTELKSKGLPQTEIAAKLGMNTRQLRDNITWANADREAHHIPLAKSLKESGLSNVAIGQKLGVSEATVRNYLTRESSADKVRKKQLDTISEALKLGVDNTGYLDVGVGVERQLGVSREKFKAMVNKLVEDEGYHLHDVFIPRLSDPTGTKYTTTKVLTKDPDVTNTRKNSDKIRPLDSWSEDGGLSLTKSYPPHMLDLNRIKVRYAEEGGADKDGLIELRQGVQDLDLGRSKYAQVRIGAGENLYLKGMAAYSDDKHFPKGVDIIFNTNKKQGTTVEKVLKEVKMSHKETSDPSAIFGSSVVRQKGALNIVNEQGDWDKWSGKMSSQFLSKQSTTLIKERLDDTYSSLRKEYDEINAMTNPVVKKFLMDKYIEGLDSKANHLKAKGIKGTKSHVLLPFPDMKPNEIYAPNFKDGERVVLVRHPHGGIFEIPDLVVNNKFETARKMLGSNAPDAVGIHPTVAEKLSGADFDGDTALVIPNRNGNAIKTSRTLKELKGFDPKMYQVDHATITPKYKGTLMGVVSNLITDMTIKGASEAELARAVKHSMVVIDAEKHKLDYKQSAIDNGISALIKKYQTHTSPETGKISKGASTLISRSKQKIDISQHETVKELNRDKVDKNGKILKKGLSPSEIATKLKISEDTVNGYLYKGEKFSPDKYSSGTAREDLYVGYIKGVMGIKEEATKTAQGIGHPEYSKEAAKLYAPEIASLNVKLNTALLNAPRERQAQLLTNNLFYANFHKDMDKDAIKKLKSRSLQKARDVTGAKKSQIEITDKEWEAIQARAVSNTKLLQILDNANMDRVRELATPRERKLSTARTSRAQLLLDKGYTLAQVADTMGVSTDTIMNELGLRRRKGSSNNE
jgi:DNA-binding CsgD family transcriptional regulator